MADAAEERDWRDVSVFSCVVVVAVVVAVAVEDVDGRDAREESRGAEAAISFEMSLATSFETAIGRAATRFARFVAPSVVIVVRGFVDVLPFLACFPPETELLRTGLAAVFSRCDTFFPSPVIPLLFFLSPPFSPTEFEFEFP